MQPKVTLVNFTPRVLETVYILWEASKVDGRVELDPETVARTVPEPELEKLFWEVIRQKIPVGEHLNFIFMLEGISVSWREQAVRHRIGTKVGDRIGVDIIPDLASSTFWSQSMRIQDMGKFSDHVMYRVPETLRGKTVHQGGIPVPAERFFSDTMDLIQDAYNALVTAGVPMEDARELIPLGAQHRISWAVNLQSLLHVLAKRGCWILQLGVWGPIIHGMVEELATKVHPMFRRVVEPPCISPAGQFKECVYRKENSRRMEGLDNHPACPLYLCRDHEGQAWMDRALGEHYKGTGEQRKHKLTVLQDHPGIPRAGEMNERAQEYAKLWGKDPYTWE